MIHKSEKEYGRLDNHYVNREPHASHRLQNRCFQGCARFRTTCWVTRRSESDRHLASHLGRQTPLVPYQLIHRPDENKKGTENRITSFVPLKVLPGMDGSASLVRRNRPRSVL